MPAERENQPDEFPSRESQHPDGWRDDPSMLRSRREAFLILGLWACCFLWTTIYCYLNGYLSHEPLLPGKSTGPDIAAVVGPLTSFNRDPATLTMPFGLGIPDWVFWGIVVPWLICIILSILFCSFVFAEDDLSSPAEMDDVAEN